MGGFAQKPGATTLVQQQARGPNDMPPGKRTLVEQTDAVGSTTAPRTPGHAAAAHDGAGKHSTPDVSPPAAGIDKPGFIDNSKGAPVYNKPAELGGGLVRETPLPPAAR